jgi:hypothetical protein
MTTNTIPWSPDSVSTSGLIIPEPSGRRRTSGDPLNPLPYVGRDLAYFPNPDHAHYDDHDDHCAILARTSKAKTPSTPLIISHSAKNSSIFLRYSSSFLQPKKILEECRLSALPARGETNQPCGAGAPFSNGHWPSQQSRDREGAFTTYVVDCNAGVPQTLAHARGSV